MQGTWRDGFAQVTDALAQRGIVAGSYDDCEIWDVAAMCGANRPPEPDKPGEDGMGGFRAG